MSIIAVFPGQGSQKIGMGKELSDNFTEAKQVFEEVNDTLIFNKVFTYNGIDFYDDYAHHPTEIKVVLEGVNKVYQNFDKVCIFQPHRISRLKDLRKEFSYAFKDADTVILCPIYTAGEKIKLGFNYLKFAKEIILSLIHI